MKISQIAYYTVELPRFEPFKIATGTSSSVKPVIVRIEGEGHVGWGAASPNSVTAETVESISAALDTLSKQLANRKFTDIPEANDMMDAALAGIRASTGIPTGGSPAAKAGIDIALWDLKGQIEGRPVCDILGRTKECQLTDMTLGIGSEEKTLFDAGKWLAEGFTAFKVKIGLDLEGDIKRIQTLRNAIGDRARLWVDANQGYTVEEALRFANAVQNLDIEFIEQPVKFDDLAALKEVKGNSPIPIMADESVKSPADARRIVEMGCADMLNIKLMKCGGITRAREIASISKYAGIPNMIGCMGESVVSVAGALHFALSEENVKFADLDSHFSLVEDVADGIRFENGCLFPSGRAGLGLRITKGL